MFRTPVKRTNLEIDGRLYPVQYFEGQTLRGGRRFSCEVMLDGTDRIIIDDDSMPSLESRVERLAPATVYSRLLAARGLVAA